MSLFRFTTRDPDLRVDGDGIYLRPPIVDDFREWALLRAQSRAFLEPWEPIWPADDLTLGAFRRRVKRYAQEIRDEAAFPFLMFRSEDDTLVGGLTLGLLRRGVSQSCAIGYWIGEPFARQGYMTRGLTAALGFGFDGLRLRRIEAACVPGNDASVRLLEKVGFVREGLARQYLCINGVWRDHYLYAILRSDLG